MNALLHLMGLFIAAHAAIYSYNTLDNEYMLGYGFTVLTGFFFLALFEAGKQDATEMATMHPISQIGAVVLFVTFAGMGAVSLVTAAVTGSALANVGPFFAALPIMFYLAVIVVVVLSIIGAGAVLFRRH